MQSVNMGEIHLKRQHSGTLVAITSVACDVCKDVYPFLVRFHAKHKDVQMIVMMIGEREPVLETIQQFGMTMPIVQITGMDFRKFQTGYIPFVYYVNQDGRVRAKSVVSYEEQLYLLLNNGQEKKAS
ncbi:Thiol-disulfide oxidoreductase ResA [compost metagenome]